MGTPQRPDRRSGRATRRFLRFVEEHAMALREQAGLGSRGRLDPFLLQASLGIFISTPGTLGNIKEEDREHLKSIDARTWSGGATELPDGKLLILLNPNQTPERAAVTVMEEVAHAHFGHQPVTLVLEPTGVSGRRYDEIAENEAYWTAAAALLPSAVVARAVWDAGPAKTLAADYGVSVELVEFRIKTLRLWPWYQSRRVAA